jgi:hypothetical protein
MTFKQYQYGPALWAMASRFLESAAKRVAGRILLEQIRQDIASTTTGVTLRHLDLWFDTHGTTVTSSTAATSPGTFVQSMPTDHVFMGNT